MLCDRPRHMTKYPKSSPAHKLEIETSTYNKFCHSDLLFQFTTTNLLDSLLMVLHSTLLGLDIEYMRKTTFDRRKAGMSHIDMEGRDRCSHLDSSTQVCISLKKDIEIIVWEGSTEINSSVQRAWFSLDGDFAMRTNSMETATVGRVLSSF